MPRPDNFRIILTEDGGQLSGWPELPTEATIESFIAGYTGQGVDVLSYGLLGTHLAIYDSDVVIRQHEELPPDPALENMRHLSRCGIDYPAIVAATSHRLGMQFWPTARLNNTGGVYSSLHDEHPEWFFAGYANMYGFAGGYRPMINYEIAAVREFMMRGFRELVERYDADGLQLDFTRYPSLFHPDRAWENTQLLTEYVTQIRAMLDDVGRARGRRLACATQVAAYPDHGIPYGHDVRSWIRNGLIDYILPTQPNNNDCYLPVDLWSKIVAGTNCRVFPTIHPNFAFPWNDHNRSTLELLRGTANLYYAQGAHGLSTVNMFEATQNRWFTHLRDPDRVAQGPHHYRFTFNASGRTPLDLRPHSAMWKVTTPLRIVDDPADYAAATLILTIENLTHPDELVLLLNNDVIPGVEIDPQEQHSTCRVELSMANLNLVQGVNEFAIKLDSARPPGESWVLISEIEMQVELKNST